MVEYGHAVDTSEPTAQVPLCPGSVRLKLARAGPSTIKARSFDLAGNRSAESTDIRVMVS